MLKESSVRDMPNEIDKRKDFLIVINLKLSDRQRFFEVGAASFVCAQKIKALCCNNVFSINHLVRKNVLNESMLSQECRIYVKSGVKFVLVTAHGTSCINQSQGL